MISDSALLKQYARSGSETAFAEITARYRALVYRTCHRELGSDTQAEDAAQVVFLLLARKAKTLRPRPSLAGWLFRTAVFVAKDVRKQEARRQRREQIVMTGLTQTYAAPPPEDDPLAPLLNPALASLKPADRDAVLLRCFQGLSLAETGAALGVSEDAARMRVARALDKLRHYLTAHGAAVTSVSVVAILAAEAARPIPAHAAEALPSSNVLLLSKGVSHTMKVIKLKYAALAAAVLVGGSVAVSLTTASTAKILPPPAVRQSSVAPTSGDFYANLQPPALESLILPDQIRGQSGMAGGAPHLPEPLGNLQIVTFTSPSSFKAVCQFYTDKLMPPGSTLQALGVRGDLRKQCAYSVDKHQGISAAAFSQRAPAYNVSVSVYRGASDTMTSVTLVYCLN